MRYGQGDQGSGSVDEDVGEACRAARDEGLVQLVQDGPGDADREGQEAGGSRVQVATVDEGAEPEGGEDGVLLEVCGLAYEPVEGFEQGRRGPWRQFPEDRQ